MDFLMPVIIGAAAGATYAVLSAVIGAALNQLGRKRAKGPALVLVDSEGREKIVPVDSITWNTKNESGPAGTW